MRIVLICVALSTACGPRANIPPRSAPNSMPGVLAVDDEGARKLLAVGAVVTLEF